MAWADDAAYGFNDVCADVLLTTTYRDLDDRAAAEAAGQPWCSASPIGQPPSRAGFSAERVAESHRRGAAIVVWTVNDAPRCDLAAITVVIRRARKLHYGTSRHQVGVFRAAKRRGGGHPAAPTIVLVHGGSWSWPYNRWVMWLLARDAARRGWGVFNVDYRRVGRLGGGGGWPETFDDVRTAIELMTNDTSKLGIDADRVVVVGHSAGGHLALVGSATADAPPALVVSMAGPTDLERLWSNGSQPVRDLTARAPESSRWSVTSPIHMLPLEVPTVCVHGEADSTVHPRHTTVFVEAARSAGDVAVAVLVPGETHKDALKPTSEIWAAVADSISERFS